MPADPIQNTSEADRLRAVMKWIDEVRPGTNQDGAAVVHMTWAEFNAMRVALGLRPQPPSRKGTA